GVLALMADQAVRVLTLGEEHEAHVTPVLQYRQAGLQRAPGCLATGIVPVETEDDGVDHAEQPLEMLFAGGRAECGDRIGDAVLGQCDHIHVAFHHQNVVQLTVLAAGLVQAIQLPALLEHRRFGGVQVLGLVVAQHPAAETDDPPAAVADGEDDAVAEAVVALAAVRVLHYQPGLDEYLLLGIIRGQVAHQVVPAGWSKAQVIELGDLPRQAPLLQVVHRASALGMMPELLTVIRGGIFQHRVQRTVLTTGAGPATIASLFPGYLDTGLASQLLHRLREIQPLEIHQEADGVPTGAAAEPAIDLLVGADAERGGFLVMERAQRGPVLAGLLQLDP